MKTLLVIFASFLAAATSVRADDYNTYAANRGLVTIAQIEQAKEEARAATDFRNMSIAQRWDANDKGSLARRWSDAGPGSIVYRWRDKR